jgi:hypothetical protein
MRTYVLILLLVVETCWLWAAEGIKPLDVRLGLWEVTNTVQTSGMPPVSIPPEAMANMTPEQRARVEQMMKDRGSGAPKTTTQKSCMTREKMNRQQMFNEEQSSCTHTVVTSSSSKLEMRIQCGAEGTKTNGTLRVEALNSENVKGSMQMVSSGGDRTMNMSSNFTAKWLGPNCGDVK